MPPHSRARPPLPPDKVVASFDSASVLHAATAAALRGKPFPHLGSPGAYGAAVRVGGHLPWPVLRRIYARIGAAEGIDPRDLGRVDMPAIAASFADGYPPRRYPAVLLGCSNGALTHLAAALQTPWLPGTVLIPVARAGDPGRPDLALDFGRRAGPPLLEANPDIVLHQMHDEAQDALMVARMTYFRTKWATLPTAYATFLSERLAPGAPVILVEDRSRWPVVRVAERHLFQHGARGGQPPERYLSQPRSPGADDEAPEAEWGSDPGFVAGVRAWCRAHGHPLVRIAYDGPQAVSAGVADTIRSWYEDLGRPTDRLIVPSFVLGDPWRTLQMAAVPYWTFFSVEPARHALDDYLSRTPGYREVLLLMFQHGADSPGLATVDAWRTTIERHGGRLRLVAVNERKAPHDIGSLGRYGPALAAIPADPAGWTPLSVADALDRLDRSTDVSVITEAGAPLSDAD